MIKKVLIVVVLTLLVITAYYLYDQSNTYATPTEAFENSELNFPVHEIVLTFEGGVNLSRNYTLYTSEIDEAGDYYVFAMTEEKAGGWKAADSIGGFNISKSNANGSYSLYEPMNLVHGLADENVDRGMIDDRSANIAPLPNTSLRVWYQTGISADEIENVRFLNENGEEIR